MIKICARCEREFDTDETEFVEINNELICEHCVSKEKDRLKYLLNKENCCSLDKVELFELEELLNRYGRVDYE